MCVNTVFFFFYPFFPFRSQSLPRVPSAGFTQRSVARDEKILSQSFLLLRRSHTECRTPSRFGETEFRLFFFIIITFFYFFFTLLLSAARATRCENRLRSPGNDYFSDPDNTARVSYFILFPIFLARARVCVYASTSALVLVYFFFSVTDNGSDPPVLAYSVAVVFSDIRVERSTGPRRRRRCDPIITVRRATRGKSTTTVFVVYGPTTAAVVAAVRGARARAQCATYETDDVARENPASALGRCPGSLTDAIVSGRQGLPLPAAV